VNEAAVQVYQWLNGIMPCTGDPWVEISNLDYSIMNKLNMTFGHCFAAHLKAEAQYFMKCNVYINIFPYLSYLYILH
jgi:hypothetical protein